MVETSLKICRGHGMLLNAELGIALIASDVLLWLLVLSVVITKRTPDAGAAAILYMP